MKISSINNFPNYTRTNQNKATQHTSFGAVKKIVETDAFKLSNPDGVKVLKALLENQDIKKFFSEHDVNLTFKKKPMAGGDFDTRMYIDFINEPYRDSTHFQLGSSKDPYDITRYRVAAENIRKISYESLEAATTISLNSIPQVQQNKRQEEAVAEYNKLVKELADLGQ